MIEEKFVDVDGVKLFCRIEGEGKPLLFLHGGPGSYHDYFLPFVRELGKSRKLVFYDQRGCGRSDRIDPSQYTPAHFVNELDGLIEKLELGKPDILGHSWGGMLAQLYALDHQAKVRSLILCCTSSNSMGRQKLYARLWKAAPKLSKQKLTDYLESGKLRRGQPYPSDYIDILNEVKGRTGPIPKDLRVLLDMIRAGFSWQVHAALMGGGIYEFKFDGELKDYDIRNELQRIKVPTLIISGENDADFPEKGKDMEKSIPNSKLVLFKRSGHWPFLQENNKFVKETAKFLSAVEKQDNPVQT